ncbi:MAG: bifunctional alpha/beta hydrolase/OsmC family protein [Aestuariivirgaceae bacterium]
MAKQSIKVTFPGSQGAELAAKLEMPAERPRAYALFAHCFTCSKDIFAAARIAGGLADRGIAVLRFDFTGLGKSDGEFANTNFSSNVADLLRAADFLRDNHQAPQLLIGHSLGGAAVLAAAGDVPEVRAVATIGAPADAEHVIHNFGAKIDEIDKTGEAEVTLGGRQFTVKKQFLDDVRKQSLSDSIAGMKKALMVFHAPRDQTVGIENAGAIFSAAKHPKSFISLDSADHLLSRREDAIYVADVLTSWSARFLDPDSIEQVQELSSGVTRVEETGQGKFQQSVRVGTHRLIADEPRSVGGLDSGPTPYDFLSIALGTCTAMTLRMYTDRKGLQLGRISVDISHEKVHADDCIDCGEGREGRIDRFERVIKVLDTQLDSEMQGKLVEIAGKCPVHRTLEASSVVATKIE